MMQKKKTVRIQYTAKLPPIPPTPIKKPSPNNWPRSYYYSLVLLSIYMVVFKQEDTSERRSFCVNGTLDDTSSSEWMQSPWQHRIILAFLIKTVNLQVLSRASAIRCTSSDRHHCHCLICEIKENIVYLSSMTTIHQ